MSRISYAPNRIIDNNGIADGGSLYVYQSGTTTPISLYLNEDCTIPATNPYVVATGAAVPYLYYNYTGSIRLYVVSTSGDIQDQDPYNDTSTSSSVAIDVTAYGALGDGTTDDTVAIHAAFDAALANNAAVYFPYGVYRVTSGYDCDVVGGLRIYGDNRNHIGTNYGSIIKLDNASSASYFMKVSIANSLFVHDLNFTCAQTVTDREFFVWASATSFYATIYFDRVAFEGVEKPINFKEIVYFQMAAIRNTQFRNSGMIYTSYGGTGDTYSLRGTLFILDNVNHEESTPANSDLTVCDLRSIREIVATNFLLEGTLPAAGWTVLKLSQVYAVGSEWARRDFFRCTNFHSEWVGDQPTYVVEQTAGTAAFDHLVGLSASRQYRLVDGAKVIVKNQTFSDSADDPASYFSREDSTCTVEFIDCNMRLFDPTERGFLHTRTNLVSTTAGLGHVITSNTACRELYRWDGGYVEDGGDLSLFIGTDFPYPSTDATYGRKLMNVATSAMNFNIRVKTKGQIAEGDQLYLHARIKLPTWTAGSLVIALGSNVGSLHTKTFTTADSATTQDIFLPAVVQSGFTFTSFGLAMSFSGASGVSGGVEIYSLVIGYGHEIPMHQMTMYPERIQTFHTAAPTTGTWVQGDIVWNTSVAAAGSPGWICTTGGTPGTWKAMAAVAA